jgi:putative transposase
VGGPPNCKLVEMSNSFRAGARAYVTGLLVRLHNANCVRLAARVGVSHDLLSRVLKNERGRVFSHVSTLILKTLGKISGGSLIIDDTTITKHFAKVIEGCSWLWSSNDERVVFGYQVVVLLWSNGSFSIPLKWEFYKKETDDEKKKNQRTKLDIAIDLLAYAKNTLRLSPERVLFDSFYSAEKVLLRCEEYGWQYVTKIKSNRKLNGKQARKHHRNPYWEESGVLTGGLKARIIRHGKRYFLTNDFNATKQVIISFYDSRWVIEEMFRVLHSRLGLDECESRSKTAQSNHTALVMSAYVLLASEETRSESDTYYTAHDKCLADTDFAARLVEEGFSEPSLVGA